jgi:hypothetical protein
MQQGLCQQLFYMIFHDMGLLPVIARAALKTAYCKPSGVAEEILFT